jgi:hypothetical protein
MSLTLVILAAGMGSRYGGLKQLDPVGPHGATIMDYSVYDAIRAGFDRVVFIIRHDIEDDFKRLIGSRYESQVAVDYAYQRIDDIPAGFTVPADRTKPWGTGQAVLAARERIDGPCSVINADDYYGVTGFRRLADFLRSDEAVDGRTHAMVAYRIADTLSAIGSVSRGICEVDDDGRLVQVTETHEIVPEGGGAAHPGVDGSTVRRPADTPVSMNLWGFAPSIMAQLATGFEQFFAETGGAGKAEYHLPTGVQGAMARGEATVRVLRTDDRWFGVTHREDKAQAEAAIADLIAQGVYPERLW